MRLILACLVLLLPACANAQALFNLSSPILEEGKTMPLSAVYDGNDCIGQNTSPPLQWSGAPEGTKSFSITMFDPDARDGSGWLHWVVFNIPANVSQLAADAGSGEEGALPEPAHSIGNHWGKNAYSGACPPMGDKPHRYQFTIYAMRDALAFYPLSAIGKPTVNWLREHSLAHTTLTVTYGR